jgi:hypothetical protein
VAESLLAELPEFEHMKDRRDLQNKMKGLARAEQLAIL